MSDETTRSIRPEPDPVIVLGVGGWLRWFWRQLTTMRVALQLLFLLAIAAIPGSIYPQRTQSQVQVAEYIKNNPETAPFLDALGMFDVYGSVWFSAIYLLLMTSLVGCIIPRMGVHWRASRSAPPKAPQNLIRLAGAESFEVFAPRVEVSSKLLEPLSQRLESQRWRVVHQPLTDADAGSGYISAERGYMRETGNLIFHIAVVVILLAVGFGSLFGYRGQVIIREGTSLSNVLAQYDSFVPGRLFDTDDLVPFNVELEDLKVTYEDEGRQIGTARDFQAFVKYRETPESEVQSKVVGVNNPLDIGNASMFLIGHGYAPVFRVTDSNGVVVFEDSVVFLPQDGNFTSTGVLKIADMEPQLGLDGIFAPTGVVTEERGPHSLFPDTIDPVAFLSAWSGDLGLDDGVAQNVYILDKTNLKRVGLEELRPGETWKLPNASVEFLGVRQFATFNIASDPAQNVALAGSLLAIVGVIGSLYIQRRRVFIRVVEREGRTMVEVAAISRAEDTDVTEVIQSVAQQCREILGVEKSGAIKEIGS